MKTLFDSVQRQSLVDRIGRLKPDSPRKFGTLTVELMLCHLGDHLRLALGDMEPSKIGGLMALPGVRWLIICHLPWPKGRTASPPEQLVTKSENMDTDREALLNLVARFAERGESGSFGAHPLFGRLPAGLWGRLAARHIEYHLDQFSV